MFQRRVTETRIICWSAKKKKEELIRTQCCTLRQAITLIEQGVAKNPQTVEFLCFDLLEIAPCCSSAGFM